ncbi:hypothetical protein MMC20_005800 [Loxospora ochrophaea]|nr:hypothetical protein [Loxospora ochrophaea]
MQYQYGQPESLANSSTVPRAQWEPGLKIYKLSIFKDLNKMSMRELKDLARISPGKAHRVQHFARAVAPSNANADIRQCNDQNNNWVCSRDPSDCSNSFEVPWGFVDDHRTGNLSNVLYPPQPSSTSSNSSQTSAAATNSLSAAPASAPTASGPANFDTSSCPTTNLSWREAAIGAGVGVPLAVALAISLALLVREKRVSKRAQIPSSSPGLAIPLQNAKNTRDYYHELGPDPTHAAVEVEGSGVRPSAYSRNQNKGAYIAE